MGGLVSKPLVRTTLEVVREAGIQVEHGDDLVRFRIRGGQEYQPREYTVNGDYPSAAAILGAGAVTRSDIAVERLYQDCQGERAVIPLLRQMGAEVEYDGREVRLGGHGGLRGVAFDGDRATDMVLAMLAVSMAANQSTLSIESSARYTASRMNATTIRATL